MLPWQLNETTDTVPTHYQTVTEVHFDNG